MESMKLTSLNPRVWTAAGRWQIGGDGAGGIQISHPKRPTWLQRYLMRTLLTITWVDGEHDVAFWGRSD